MSIRFCVRRKSFRRREKKLCIGTSIIMQMRGPALERGVFITCNSIC
jgi:hypothetical protein